ncbi:hypothetical protein LIER_18753 [Lithospermum erythrorhizon]|uniref:non-specific serine/threonine protein kinase n=1 Tax=Lithospermum erythrorhizon TaxID=34254 RepID=A0AAV3QJK8_LITER
MSNKHKLICYFILFLFVTSSFSQLDEFIFTGFKNPKTNLTLSGVAEISQNGILQLTNETSRLQGHAFYSLSLKFKNTSNGSVFSFSTCFAFAIVPEYPRLGGHGLAFTIAPSQDLSSALPSQYLGLLNASVNGNLTNHLFAVEFDTVQDFEFGDINDNHIGIDVDSMRSNASAPAAYFDDDGLKKNLTLKGGKSLLAWIDYDSSSSIINVTVSPFSRKPRLPVLSYELDLSSILKENMYVGFSASTGLLASKHYILGWSFKMNGESANLDLHSLPSLPGIKKKNTGLIVGVSVGSAVFMLGLIIGAIFLMRKIKNAESIEPWELEIGPHRYKYKELKQATRGFKESELLGSGGFGKVYKGTLPNSRIEVAVKRISHESRQGLREFVSEIASIGRLRHRNLVQLLGWCRRGDDLLLVYDYMPNASLDNFLFDDPNTTLSWEQRFKIIKGVASALLYLHEGYEQVVVHRDVKASNVLLDGDLNGRLGDFGLARLCDHGENPSTTRVVGTLGYLAPELPRTGKATVNSDIFAFGALLLEVVCGRRPVEPKAGQDELVLVDLVWKKWREGSVLEVVDEKLKNEFDENEVMMVIKLGLMCSNHSPSSRPSMRQVVSYFEGEIGVPLAPRTPNNYEDEFNFDEVYEQSAMTYPFSTFDKANSYTSFKNINGTVDSSFASISTSPVSLLYTERETR